MSGACLSSTLFLALAAQDPDVTLPHPTGASPVGTSVHYLVDGPRKSARFPDGQPVTLQLWYPTTAAEERKPRAPYLVEQGLARTMAEQGYYEVEAERLEAWAKLTTNARLDAAPAPGSHALLLFSVGLGVVRANYTTLAEELASHGFVFALVESPLAGLMLRPDGTVVRDTGDRLERADGHREAVDEWCQDLRFVLNRLAGEGGDASLAALAATLDLKRVATLGHSSGGLVALQFGVIDARVRAGIDLDGGLVTPEGEPLARFVTSGMAKPALILRSKPLYGEADFARRGLTREQWEARGAAGKAALAALASRSTAPLVVAGVAGTGHFSFSDAPFVMPAAITRFGGEIIEPRRGWLVITGAIRAFLDETLAAQPGRTLADALREFSELVLQEEGGR
jgi:dienelactone hydrolase